MRLFRAHRQELADTCCQPGEGEEQLSSALLLEWVAQLCLCTGVEVMIRIPKAVV